jgi:dTDP-4-amino-4,6-dideoxygalactose transaminase
VSGAPPVVPLVDLAWQRDEVATEVTAGLDRVLAATAFVGGPDVAAFEAEFAAATGRQHCIGVGNGTDALELALRAGGVGPGHRIAVPATTFVATAEAVARTGAETVLVDVDDDHLLLDPGALDRVEGRVDGVVPVHLYGQLAPMAAICERAAAHGWVVVEDAAQAHGARQDGHPVGSWGVAAATSFYPGKNLGAYGDAGAVVTDDPVVARAVRLLSQHGAEQRYRHEVLGFNSRLDTVQAVVLRAKLPRLAAWNALRTTAAARYRQLLDGVRSVRLPAVAPGNEHVWHLYVVRVPARDAVLADLLEAGIGAGVHYPVPLHRTGPFADPDGAARYPVAERAATECLSLPVYPGITPEQQEQVVEALVRAVDRHG